MKRPKLVIFKGNDGWYWKLVGGNGEIQCLSEAYTQRADAERGAKAARRNMLISKFTP